MCTYYMTKQKAIKNEMVCVYVTWVDNVCMCDCGYVGVACTYYICGCVCVCAQIWTIPELMC